jgi:hypothetical protein
MFVTRATLLESCWQVKVRCSSFNFDIWHDTTCRLRCQSESESRNSIMMRPSMLHLEASSRVYRPLSIWLRLNVLLLKDFILRGDSEHYQLQSPLRRTRSQAPSRAFSWDFQVLSESVDRWSPGCQTSYSQMTPLLLGNVCSYWRGVTLWGSVAIY